HQQFQPTPLPLLNHSALSDPPKDHFLFFFSSRRRHTRSISRRSWRSYAVPSKVISVNPLDGLPQSSFKRNPLHQVRVLYVSYVRGLFAQAQPGQYHWCDGEESEIFISDEAPVDASSVGQRPAISFTRSAVQFSSLGHDDFLKYDFETGRKTKSVLVPGVMSINCCSSNDL